MAAKPRQEQAEEPPGDWPADGGGGDPLGDQVSVTSGQSMCQKAVFAVLLISPLGSATVLTFAKDVFILEMGCDSGLMGILSSAVVLWAPFCFPLSGYCMDRDILGGLFPWETWGRRAPWFLVHSGAIAVTTCCMYLPPSLDKVFVCWWFFFWSALLAWSVAVLFNCFSAARIEMYPTKEERSETEGFTKVAAGVAYACGIIPAIIVATNSSFTTRLTVSVWYFASSLFSLVGLPLLRTARQEFSARLVKSPLREMRDLMRNRTYCHFVAARTFETLATTIVVTGTIYYLTLVEEKTGSARSDAVFGIGGIVGVVGAFSIPPWTIFFRKRRRDVNTNHVCGAACALGCLAPLALWLGSRFLPSPCGVFAYVAVVQLTWAGQSFWRCNAMGWLIDEDTMLVSKRRREAVFAGCANLIVGLGFSLAVALIMNGLSIGGLDLQNCQTVCAEIARVDRAVCRDTCQNAMVRSQPESTRNFMRIMFYVVAPCFQLLAAACTYTFPIHGGRLDAIYRSQAVRYSVTCAPKVLGAHTDKLAEWADSPANEPKRPVDEPLSGKETSAGDPSGDRYVNVDAASTE